MPERRNGKKSDVLAKAACPICGKATVQAFRPFCSKRCADVDLNRWLTGVYAVPATDADDEAERPPDPDRKVD